MEAEQSFGKWLRHRRRELDLTQEEFARLVGCAPITIRKLEGDEMRPSKQLADGIGGHLGIPLDRRERFVRLARDGASHPVSDFDLLTDLPGQPAQRSHDHLPAGTLTMLFSNIGHSTQLGQKLGDHFPALLDEYRRILRDSCRKWNGYEVDSSGDSFFAVFAGAPEAVAVATECQSLLAAHSWKEGVQVQVRMGLHTGQPQRMDGNYAGVEVNRAAHLCAAAYAGQVLLTDETRALVERYLPPETSLRDLGKYRLKESNDPEHVYQLVIRGLPSDFPRLKAIGMLPNNLPLQLTSFIGRERQIADIQCLLTEARLTTLTGPGGSGKTRIAAECASRMLEQFPDGVWLIDFVAIHEDRLIEQILASVLQVREEPDRPLLQTLEDYLRPKKILLLFDNCEHLIAGCAQVADVLLQTCPQLRMLATSREPLGIAGENLYYVPTLTLPAEEDEISPTALMHSEAVRVFLDRAVMMRPAFQMTENNAPAIAQICRRLDGIPLAVELAAARVKSLSVEQIRLRLDGPSDLLGSGPRTAMPRHQTLRAVIDWSYNLLSEKEKILLCRLSLFAGGWTLEAAAKVCTESPADEPEIVSLLSNLADKSLVIMEERAGTTRYRFLETIRQYALEKLSESGDADRLRHHFVEYYTHLAEEAEQKFRGADQLHWLKIMETDRDNMRAAFEYGLQMSQIEPVRHLVGTAFWLWFFRGPWSEGQVWAEAVLARSPQDSTPSRARVLMALGLFQYVQSHYPAANAAFDESIAIWRELGDAWWCAFVLAFSGLILRIRDREAADALFTESLALAQQANEKWIIAFALWNIGENELYGRNLPEARRILQESLEASQDIGDQLLQIEVLRVLGGTEEAEGNYLAASRLYGQSLAIIERFGDTTNISVLHYDLGRAAQLGGDNDKATDHFTKAIHWSMRLGKQPGILRAIAGLGVVAAARGQTRRGVVLLTASHARLAALGTNIIFSSQHPQSMWFDGYLAAARAQLGEEEFAAASAEGQAMTLEQLVELALRRD